ncbi:MAG: hypothetical protein QNL04_08235, partial [SAR324 cluster bacterium]|nr:hypothetical protein [SAR324 cluster bacterium]
SFPSLKTPSFSIFFVKILAAMAFVFLLSPSLLIAEDKNNAALVLSKSSSTYFYHAIISYTEETEKLYQTTVPFEQEDLTFGFVTPSLRASVFYLNLGVYFHSLKQIEQVDCTGLSDWDSCPKAAVSEPTYLQVREMATSLGMDFNWLKLEIAYVNSKMTGNFFFSQRHFDLGSVSNYLLGSVITEFQIIDSLKVGASFVGTRDLASNEDASGEVLQPHLEYSQYNAFVKFVF